MSLLIGLQAPVLGFCQHSQTFFITEHHCEPEHYHHHGDHNHHHVEQPDPEPEPSPCDDCHEFLSLDVDDFLWTTAATSHEVKFSSCHLSFSTSDFSPAPQRKIEAAQIPRPPPPPGEPHFRLHSEWRL
ncbi:MAG: hypothetical protein ABF377_04650 [Akkermansiaceae bacterium]